MNGGTGPGGGAYRLVGAKCPIQVPPWLSNESLTQTAFCWGRATEREVQEP